jgi:TRAP-type C4-dicarboxylate transport system permease small subunit
MMIEQNKKNNLKSATDLFEIKLNAFTRSISFVGMLAAIIMMLLVVADVFMRRVLNMPILGSNEIQRILLTVVIFFSVAYVMSIKGHVVVDTLTRLYSRKLQIAVSIIALLLSMLIIAVISWQTALYGIEALNIGERSVLLRIPVSPFIFVVAFGSAVLFLVILAQFLSIIVGKNNKNGSP